MPTFCRHNRFIERCPICSKTLPGHAQGASSTPRAKASPRTGDGAARRHTRGESLRIRREGRAEDDGYRSTLAQGLRASADASRLAQEIAFSSGRLLALGAQPPEPYGEIRARVAASSSQGKEDLESATWACFLIAYLGPLDGADAFAGIRPVLAVARWDGELPDLDEVPVGPRTSHVPGRGADTLVAYRQWVQRAGGSQALAFGGDHSWTPQRRFERVFERSAIAGFGRAGRYELLVTLGRLGLYELTADSLHLAGAGALSSEDLTTQAAKRVFGIGDPLLLERRVATLAEAIAVPVETLDLALANWSVPQRATMGFPSDTCDEHALTQALDALGL